MKKRSKKPKRVLALDIGTRSIVGLIMEQGEEETRIDAVEYLEHETRAMFDGQIHDVETVALEISRVKAKLEEQTGKRLRSAAVAAAGRALKTSRSQVIINRPPTEEISWQEVQALELEAVQQAMHKIAQEETAQNSSGYFCVGYSVVNYLLENQELKSLVGQIGNRIGVEVIATFLPRVVVDSLFSALKRVGLEISSLTLEPIAAIAAAIPANMRLLNLALVDIGAGTSDIALVVGGSVFAYAMVPMGGDEITEALAEKYLLDFNTAEKIKCQLKSQDSVEFTDVLENRVSVTSAEMIEQITPMIKELAVSIAREIMAANQKSPEAVICVGGGSLTPNLLKEIAGALELPGNRVGVRSRETLAHIKGEFPELAGPQSITPIGIALEALNTRPLPLVKVTVNNRDIPMWALHEITVATALLASGFNLNNIYGRPGMGLTIKLNGELKVFKGKVGHPPVILVNGAPAGLDTSLKEGDQIDFERGANGEDALVRISDLVAGEKGSIFLRGEEIAIPALVYINGSAVQPQEIVPDRAGVEIVKANKINEILIMAGVAADLLRPREFHYILNDEAQEFDWIPCEPLVEGKPVGLHDMVAFGSRIDFHIREDFPPLREVIPVADAEKGISITVNGRRLELPTCRTSLTMNGKTVTPGDSLEEDAVISFRQESYSPILSDLLVPIALKPQTSGRLILRVNGEEAGYTTPINEGDVVDIYFDDSP
jgi:cell division protein FtsA